MAFMEIVNLEPVKVAALRRQMTFAAISRAFDDLFWWVKSMGLTPSGPGMGIYYTVPGELAEGKVDFEVCLPVTGEAVGDSQVEVKTLEGGTFAQAVHVGPYDKVGEVYAQLDKELASSDYMSVGPPREIYDVGLQQVDDPGKYSTRIVFPVSKK